ncbi:ROK family protein [Candidatus Bathyarchaeota archaeon]|nr:ROK family protein [Candidatus Bathyarchaeota archaeon]
MKQISDYVVGVDLGATNIVSLLISRDGEVVARDTRETMGEKGKKRAFSQIVNSARNVIGEGERSGISSKSILGMGIGGPGPLNSDGGVIHLAPNIPGWINTYLVKELEDELKLNVFLENDANAAALGEWWLGAGRDVDNLVLLTLGTGVGGGIIIDGEVLHGARNTAGEIGHMIIRKGGLLCGCGNRGCLEAYASARSVVKRTLAAIKEGKKTILTDLVKNKLKDITCKLVYDTARKGDSLCKWVVEETGRYLGIGITNIVNIINPEMVILGGGMANAGDLLFEPVRKYVREHSFTAAMEGVKIVPAALGVNAGAIGAVAFVLKKKGLLKTINNFDPNLLNPFKA